MMVEHLKITLVHFSENSNFKNLYIVIQCKNLVKMKI